MTDAADAAAATEAATTAEGPVQGPAAPAYSDLVWATGTTAATMADPGATLAQREAAAEAEQATYIAARHLGVNDPEPDVYARELELAGMEPEAGPSPLAPQPPHPEPEAGL